MYPCIRDIPLYSDPLSGSTPATFMCSHSMFDYCHAVGEEDNQQPLVVSKNVIHRKEIQEMLLEMRGEEKTTEKKEKTMEKKEKMVKVVSASPEKNRQIANAATTHTSSVSTAIGVLVIACNRPSVTRALDLLLKLVIKITGILHDFFALYIYVYLGIDHQLNNSQSWLARIVVTLRQLKQ